MSATTPARGGRPATLGVEKTATAVILRIGGELDLLTVPDLEQRLADAREVRDCQTEDQRDARYDLEIDQCPEADLSNALQVSGRDDAEHDVEEDQGCHDRLDQLQEDVAQHLHREGKRG